MRWNVNGVSARVDAARLAAPEDRADAPTIVETLTSAGFEIAVEQVSMSFGGHALPGKRDLYLALMHPTLG
jgi:hypothetical protein